MPGPGEDLKANCKRRYGLWQPTLALRRLWQDGPRLNATFQSGARMMRVLF
jgi:hypothetical protein